MFKKAFLLAFVNFVLCVNCFVNCVSYYVLILSKYLKCFESEKGIYVSETKSV